MLNPIKYLYHNVLPLNLKREIDQWRFPNLNPKNAYFPYFDQTKTIFVHIPKTAGTSISQALYKEQPKHHPLKIYKNLDSERFENYFKFAFVRSPYDRLYSTYRYARKISHPVYRGPLSDIAKYDSFEQFVFEWCDRQKISEHYFLKAQVDYLSLGGDSIDVDFVGKFENLQEDFNRLCKLIGIDATLPVSNVSTSDSERKSAYTTEMKNKISDIYKLDFELFDY